MTVGIDESYFRERIENPLTTQVRRPQIILEALEALSNRDVVDSEAFYLHVEQIENQVHAEVLSNVPESEMITGTQVSADGTIRMHAPWHIQIMIDIRIYEAMLELYNSLINTITGNRPIKTREELIALKQAQPIHVSLAV